MSMGEQHVTPATYWRVLAETQAAGGGTIYLEPGEYHLQTLPPGVVLCGQPGHMHDTTIVLKGLT